MDETDEWPGEAHDDTDNTVPPEAQYTAGDEWPGQEWPGSEIKAESTDQWPGQEWPGTEVKDKPQAEGVLATGAREAAHSAVPAATGVLGAGLVTGALAGSTVGPVGTFLGGLGGMIAGAYLGNAVQDKALKAAGYDDDIQRAVNEEVNPKSAFVGGLVPFVGSPVLAAEKGAGLVGQVTGNALKQRLAGGALMSGFEGVQQAYQTGDVDLGKMAGAGAFGVAMPAGNAATRALHGVGENLGRRLGPPGRPDLQARPGADVDKADADVSQSPSVAGNNALAQQPAAPNKAPIGQENSKAAGPEDYRKSTPRTIEEAFGEPPSTGFSAGEPTATNATLRAALAPEPVEPGQVVNTGIMEAAAQRPQAPEPPPPVDPRIEQAKQFNAAVNQEFAGKRGGPPPDIKAKYDANLRLIRGEPEPQKEAATLPRSPPEVKETVTPPVAELKPEYTPEQQAERLAAIEAKGRKPQAVLAPEENAPKPATDDTALLAKMRKQGMNKLADLFEKTPEKGRDLMRNQILANMPRDRTVEKAGLKNKIGMEANSKEQLAKHNSAIDAIQKAHDDHPPGVDETADQLMARLHAAVNTAHEANGGNPLGKKSGYRPLKAPDTFKWFKLVQDAAGKNRAYWTKDKIDAFRAEEDLLRSGADERPYKSSLESEIGLNQRTGDAVVEAIKNREAGENPYETENNLAAALDAKKAGAKTAEEALSKIETEEDETAFVRPKREQIKSRAQLAKIEGTTLDTSKPEDAAKLASVLEAGEKAKKLKDQIAARAEEAMKEKGAKRSGISLTPDEVTKLGGNKIVKGTEVDPAEKARIAAEFAKAEARGKSRAAPKKTYVNGEKYSDFVQDLTGAFVKLSKDEGGGLKLDKILDDLHDWSRPHYVSSARAKTLTNQEARDAASISDKLQEGIQQDKIDKAQALKFANGPEVKPFKNPVTQKELYLAHEKNDFSGIKEKGGDLPGPLDFYEKYGKPIMEENAKLKALIDNIAPDKLGRTVLNHIYRMAEGANFKEDTGPAYDPVTGTHNPLSTRERGTALERTFVALTRSDGKRFIVSLAPEGAEHSGVVWDKYKGTKFKDPNFEFEDGKTYKIGKNSYKMGDALTEEIEANALNANGEPMKYKKNFIESALAANTYLRSLARHLQLLEDIKNSPEFQAHSTKDYDYAREHGWEKSKTTLPGFEGHYMDPQIREVLDDFQQPGFNEESLNKLRNLSRAVTKTIFWLPTAHAFNVGAHWYVGRGWDWITPQGYKSLAVDGMRAIRSVIAQDSLQRRLARNGWGGVYSGILGQDFEARLARGLGAEIERQPSKWGPVADKLDMTVGDLARAVYDASSKSMWAANDMFLTQSILENLRKAGVNEKSATDLQIQQAIKAAERHIPNYRMPSRLIFEGDRGRTLAKALGDPLAFAFGRYHVGVYNSFAHMAKDLVKGSGPERFQAIGHLMAMASLVWMVKPIVDMAWQSLTGNEKAEARGRGPLGPIENAKKVRETGDIVPLLRSTLTLSPLAAVTADVLTDMTGFGNKDIINREDMKKAAGGNVKGAYNVAKQVGGYAAGNLVAPLGTLNNALGADRSLAGSLRDQVLDISNPTDRAIAFKNKIDAINHKNTVRREKRPPTIFEKLLP